MLMKQSGVRNVVLKIGMIRKYAQRLSITAKCKYLNHTPSPTCTPYIITSTLYFLTPQKIFLPPRKIPLAFVSDFYLKQYLFLIFEFSTYMLLGGARGSVVG
jgi:hypothetical protein